MAEISEQASIADVESRLKSQYSNFGSDAVSSLVQCAHARFEQSPLRDFVPLLVERRVREELEKGDVPALVTS